MQQNINEKIENLLPKIARFWVYKLIISNHEEMKDFPDFTTEFKVSRAEYDSEYPYLYRLFIDNISADWRIYFYFSSIKEEDEYFFTNLHFYAIYYPTADKIKFSRAADNLKTIIKLKFKVQKNDVLDVEEAPDTYVGSTSKVLKILENIKKDPLTMAYMSLVEYNSVYSTEYRTRRQMHRYVKKWLAKNNRYNESSRKGQYKFSLLKKKIIKNADWSKSAWEMPGVSVDWSKLEDDNRVAIIDNGDSVSPRYDVVVSNDVIVEANNILFNNNCSRLCLSLEDDECRPLEKFVHRYEKLHKVYLFVNYSFDIVSSELFDRLITSKNNEECTESYDAVITFEKGATKCLG